MRRKLFNSYNKYERRGGRGASISTKFGTLLVLLLAVLVVFRLGCMSDGGAADVLLPFSWFGWFGGADDGYKSEWPEQFSADSEGLFFWNRYAEQLAADAENVRVAIYSTHSSESYTAFSGAPKVYGEHGGVYAASSALAERLLDLGVGVFVDETIHDYPDWNKSYANSLATAERLLADYPQLDILIDMHRDAGVSRESSVAEVGGRQAARIMLVVGSAQRYENPNWQQNEAFMQQIGDKMEELYPGLLRRVSVQAGRYNQHIFEHAILVEMGTTENTIDEVEYSAQLLGDVLSEVLKNAAE
jgi:stage II sporulation protein P